MELSEADGQFLNGVIFTAMADSDCVTVSDEHRDYRWVKPEELFDYRLQESLQQSLKKMKQFSYEKSHALLRGFLDHI